MYLGRHNCLWCQIKSEVLKNPLSVRKRKPTRTLQSIRQDYQEFLDKGQGNLRKAKLHNNVIGEIFFDIPLTNVNKQCN